MRYLFTIAFVLMATPCFAVLTKTYTVCESGCDYTSVQAAETAHEQDLVANDSALTFEIQNTWASAETHWLIFGWVTDITRFLTITAVGAARASATYSTTAYRTEGAVNFNVARIREDYTVLDGIQVTTLTTGTGIIRLVDLGSELNQTVKNCFLKGNTGTAIRGIQGSAGAATATIIRNNVIIDCSDMAIDIASSAGGFKIDNNTIENCDTAMVTDANDAIARNNIIFNCTVPLSGDFNTTTLSEENWTDAVSLSYGACGSCGTGDQVSQSDPFVNLGGEDYHLASGSTPIDAGKDLSADFTDAIGGKTRDANFDKGADEFIAAGGQKIMIRK